MKRESRLPKEMMAPMLNVVEKREQVNNQKSARGVVVVVVVEEKNPKED